MINQDVSTSWYLLKLRGRAVVARLAHNQEAVGSNPTHATKPGTG